MISAPLSTRALIISVDSFCTAKCRADCPICKSRKFKSAPLLIKNSTILGWSRYVAHHSGGCRNSSKSEPLTGSPSTSRSFISLMEISGLLYHHSLLHRSTQFLTHVALALHSKTPLSDHIFPNNTSKPPSGFSGLISHPQLGSILYL